jgi:hypothetical protein
MNFEAAQVFRSHVEQQHVVPAQAGTHTPQHLDSSNVAMALFHLRGQGLWVPACAGTTICGFSD